MAHGDLDLDDPEPFVPIPDRPGPLAQVLGGLGVLDRRRTAAVAVAVVVVLAAAAAGYLLLRTPPPPPIEERLPFAGAHPTAPPTGPTASTAPPGPGPAATELVVHAAGAVAVPGVHRVPAGSRVADVLAAAGGPAADADLDRVNLAAPLTDGERVWFPRVGEEAPPVAGGTGPALGGPVLGGPVPSAGPVDINTATAEELDGLPGIGPTIAAAIVEHRERSGRFRSVDDLLAVPGIGDAKLAQLRDLVTVG